MPQPSKTDILDAQLQVLLQILACQCCPVCDGSGRVTRAASVAENLAETFLGRRGGAPAQGERCACRANAVALIEGLTGEGEDDGR